VLSCNSQRVFDGNPKTKNNSTDKQKTAIRGGFSLKLLGEYFSHTQLLLKNPLETIPSPGRKHETASFVTPKLTKILPTLGNPLTTGTCESPHVEPPEKHAVFVK
jgi:hypothetical protein